MRPRIHQRSVVQPNRHLSRSASAFFSQQFVAVLLLGACSGSIAGEPPQKIPPPESTRWNEISIRSQARIEEFWTLVNARDFDEALKVLGPSLVGSSEGRAAWRRQLDAIRSVHVRDIEPADTAAWTPRLQKFKAVLDVIVAPAAANAPIPFYGWGDNPNVRWIAVERSSAGAWLITAIATGP
jgi:hypothetical protein